VYVVNIPDSGQVNERMTNGFLMPARAAASAAVFATPLELR